MTLRGFLILLCGSFATAGVAGAGAFQVVHDLRAPASSRAAITPVAARQAAPAATTKPATAAASVAPVAPVPTTNSVTTNSATTNVGAATAPLASTQGTTAATDAAAPNPQLAAAMLPVPASAPLPPLRPHVAVCAVTPPTVKKTVTASRKATPRKLPAHVVAMQRPRIVPAEAPPQVGYPTAQTYPYTYPYYAGYTYDSSYPPTTYYRAY